MAGRVLNGRLPSTSLVPVGDGFRLAVRAAPYFLLMMAAMLAEIGSVPGINWAYRTYDEQVAMRRKHGTGAAYPGTSNHGLGLSVDLQLTRRQLTWLRRNARGFGFVEDVPNESWHWTFKTTPSVALSAPSEPISSPSVPVVVPEEEDDDMKHLRGVKLADGRLVVLNLADKTFYETSSTQWNFLVGSGLELAEGAQPTRLVDGFRKL